MTERLIVALVLTTMLMLPTAPCAAEPAPTPSTASPSPSASPEGTVPAVNPYGPTVTTTATLTNVGIPEFETFYYVSRNGSGYSQLRQTPFLIKYTFDRRWQLNLAGGGLDQILSPTGTRTAFGDITPGLKYLLVRPRNPKASSQALQFQYKVPMSDAALGFSSGRPDQQLTYFYSQDYGRVHLDVNLWTSSIGAPDGTRRLQLGQGVGFSYPLNKSGSLTMESEWHNFARAGGSVPAVSSFMQVLYCSVSPQLTLSAGVDLGLTAATPRQTWIVGAIFLFDDKRRMQP